MFNDDGSLKEEYLQRAPNSEKMAGLLDIYGVKEVKIKSRNGVVVKYRYLTIEGGLPICHDVDGEPERQMFLMAFLAGAYARECKDYDPDSRVLNCPMTFDEEVG